MRSGQTLTYEDLRRAVADALDNAGVTQRAVAEALGVSPSAVGHAKNRTGAKVARMQRRILEHLTGYRIEEEPRFLVHRSTREEREARAVEDAAGLLDASLSLALRSLMEAIERAPGTRPADAVPGPIPHEEAVVHAEGAVAAVRAAASHLRGVRTCRAVAADVEEAAEALTSTSLAYASEHADRSGRAALTSVAAQVEALATLLRDAMPREAVGQEAAVRAEASTGDGAA
jgi:transcriptional regulator with XRE-family HTH domain